MTEKPNNEDVFTQSLVHFFKKRGIDKAGFEAKRDEVQVLIDRLFLTKEEQEAAVMRLRKTLSDPLQGSDDRELLKWLSKADHDAVLVAAWESFNEEGARIFEVFSEIGMGASDMFTGHAHYFGHIDVNFKGNPAPTPLFPVFELVCSEPFPDLPKGLILDIVNEGDGAAEIALRDVTGSPNDLPVYVGGQDMSDTLKIFDALRGILGYYFFRVSHDPERVRQIRAGNLPEVHPDFYPTPGTFYRDYQVYDNGHHTARKRGHMSVVTVDSRIHNMTKQVVYLASKSGQRKFVNSLLGTVVTDDEAVAKKHVKENILNPILSITGHKLPWKLKKDASPFRSINKKMTLKHFFNNVTAVKAIAESSADDLQRVWLQEEPAAYKTLWSLMRNARPYEFTNAAYHRLNEACEEYIMGDVIGTEFASFSEFHLSFGREDAQALVSLLAESVHLVPFPEHLPFKSCYFGWGPGIRIDGLNLVDLVHVAAQRNWERDEIDELVLLGNLVTEDGWVLSFYNIFPKDHDVVETTVHVERHPDQGWLVEGSIMPWLVTTIVGEILSHATVEVGDLSSSARRKFARMENKKQGIPKPTPPDYYTVYVRDKHIVERVRKAMTGQGRKQTYRHDVEGHPRLLYQIGTLPISDKKQLSLEKREYTIYTHGTPIPEDYQAMMMERSRDFPKRGEWVALRKVFVDSFMSPMNPDLPYIPAIRKTTKGVTSANYKEEDE